jgi:TIR domain
MADASRTVFLSYRREVSWPLALAVRGDLVQHGFDVFMDTADLDSGEFERVILAQIEARTHFLVLLEPRSLDRIAEPDDWLRREIGHALRHGRAVVPLLAGGCRLPRAAELPADLQRLPSFNAVTVPSDYFAEAMVKLRERFLRKPAGPTAALQETTPDRSLVPIGAIQQMFATPTLDGLAVQMGAQLTWSVIGHAAHFELERSAGPDFMTPVQVYRGPARGYTDERARTPVAHYRVRAFIGDEAGPWSDVVAVQTNSVVAPPARPARSAPPSLRLAPEGTSVRLSWTSVRGAADYEVVHRGLLGNPEPMYHGPQPTCVLRAPARDVLSLGFSVRALDVRGVPITDWSEPVRS